MEGRGLLRLYAALETLCTNLSRQIAADGGGASRLVAAPSPAPGARRGGASGQERGRLLPGEGRHVRCRRQLGPRPLRHGLLKAPFRPEHVNCSFRSAAGEIPVCKAGEALDFDEDMAKQVLTQPEVGDPRLPERGRRRSHLLGLRPDLRLC